MRHRNQDEFTNSKFLKSMRELRSFRQTAVWTTSYDGTTEPEICSEMIRRICCPGISMISTRFDEFKLQYPRPSAKKSIKITGHHNTFQILQLEFLQFRKDLENSNSIQGPLITDGRNSCKWTGPTVGLTKSFIRVIISGQNF